MSKTLTHPLLLILAFQIVSLVILWRGWGGRKPAASSRWPILLLTLSVLILFVLSMPVTGALLQNTLALRLRPFETAPEFIVVLAGGFERGASPNLDVLTGETMKRVLFGVQLWKKYPTARLVLSGASRGDHGGRVVELMAQIAICRGVPAAAILLEPRAVNTREHPLRLRAMPGFRRTTRLAIVTSDFHERRAVAEFRRYFAHVDPQPVPSVSPLRLDDWFPSNGGLHESGAAIHEWIGIFWYRLLARIAA